jgi:hypothetical protein
MLGPSFGPNSWNGTNQESGYNRFLPGYIYQGSKLANHGSMLEN